MQVKRGLIIPAIIRRNGLSIRHPGVLDQDLRIGTRLPIGTAHKSFDRIPMVCFMRGMQDSWNCNEGTNTGCDSHYFPR